MLILKKRQALLALFLCLSFASQAQCLAEGELKLAKVKRVVDGDTVHLTDGRKVRLVGINTPELDHQHGQHEAFAVAARERLVQMLKPDGNQLYWQPAQETEDHYGRKLYYLFTKDRASISSQLLSDGLGYRIAVPPNVKYQDCLAESEQKARQAQLGIWQQPIAWQPQAGFAIVQSKITSVTHNRGGWWLETDQDLVLRIPTYAAFYWTEKELFYLQGKVIEARGWQYQRKRSADDRYKTFVLTVKHPQDLRRIKSS
ncbi:thermonuclease family protein [Marinomonas ostreistagni]|uniref:thermonuclease family protein n=1 Tax=Marinomonas ostreistagni TaxID=359209 RepID=UPI001950C8E5|nr:thermonuclease family protein [Marinomonas ostreistagni]MBM6552051.1 thermonuclease family protein [Marinomonas ostreistagni]